MKPLNGNGLRNSENSQQDISCHPNGYSPPSQSRGSKNININQIKELVIVKGKNVINSDKRNSIKCINCEINGKYYLLFKIKNYVISGYVEIGKSLFTIMEQKRIEYI